MATGIRALFGEMRGIREFRLFYSNHCWMMLYSLGKRQDFSFCCPGDNFVALCKYLLSYLWVWRISGFVCTICILACDFWYSNAS